jgi:hypothetical protein
LQRKAGTYFPLSGMAEICTEPGDAGASGDLTRPQELLESLEAEFGWVPSAPEDEVARGGN